MHTQYNLILSAGIIHRARGDHNTLVLYAEFNVTEPFLRDLESVFDRVLVVQDEFTSQNRTLHEVKYARTCLKKTKSIRKAWFDRVYMSQERLFDLAVLGQARRVNSHVECNNVEEDAYYSINEMYNDEKYQYKETIRQQIVRRVRALLMLGYPYNFRDIHYCYGMSSEYTGCNLLFPSLARRELMEKKLTEITREELLHGINAIYGTKKTPFPEAKKYVLFFFDLIDRYKNKDAVLQVVNDILRYCKNQGIQVLMKYHPRETDKIPYIGECCEISQLIPAEKVLADLLDKNVMVFGNATTSCVVAAKLGFTVVSIAKIESRTNTKMHSAMAGMGINCIESSRQIESLFTTSIESEAII